jgi:hypothetical protein
MGEKLSGNGDRFGAIGAVFLALVLRGFFFLVFVPMLILMTFVEEAIAVCFGFTS